MDARRELEGEVAIVTGAGINTGAVIAELLARAGAAVAINYRNSGAGAEENARRIIAAGGRAIAVQGDVTKEEDVRRVAAVTAERLGRPSILVNNANVRSFRALMDLSTEEWRATISPTLDGAFFCIKAVVPHMRALGRGTIVNIGGGSGHEGRPNRAHVAAAKAGIAGMTVALATELAPDNINVNLVVPGKIDVRPPSPSREPLQVKAPLGRAGEMAEIAALVRFLCGPDCRFMTGAMLHANGAAHTTIA